MVPAVLAGGTRVEVVNRGPSPLASLCTSITPCPPHTCGPRDTAGCSRLRRFASVQTPASRNSRKGIGPGGSGIGTGRASHVLRTLHIFLTMGPTATVPTQNRGLALANVPARSAVRSIAPLTAALPTPARGFSAGAPARDELERSEAVTSELQYVTRGAVSYTAIRVGAISLIDGCSACLQALRPVACGHFAVDDRCSRSRQGRAVHCRDTASDHARHDLSARPQQLSGTFVRL